MVLSVVPLGDVRATLDNVAILGALRDVGCGGMAGLQGYGVGGDSHPHLARRRPDRI